MRIEIGEVFEKYPPDAMCSGGFRKETEIGGFICPILIVRDFSEKSSAGDGSKRMRFSVKQFGRKISEFTGAELISTLKNVRQT